MAYKRRKGSIDLRRASLPILEKHLAEAQARVSSLEDSRAENLRKANLASSQLTKIHQNLAIIDNTISKLRNVRQPKDGLIASIFRITEQPAEVKLQISSLECQQTKLLSQQLELESLLMIAQSQGTSLERARSWLSKLEDVVARKRRKKDALIELRAAAASNAIETRNVGAAVKRKLIRQPWCPYCGGSLGSTPHADHIYPVSKGGRSVPKNMVYVCAQCNSMKKNLTLTGFIRKFSLDRIAIEERLEQLHKENKIIIP